MNDICEDVFDLVLSHLRDDLDTIKSIRGASIALCRKTNAFLCRETKSRAVTISNLDVLLKMPGWLKIYGHNVEVCLKIDNASRLTTPTIPSLESFLCVKTMNIELDNCSFYPFWCKGCADFATWFSNLKSLTVRLNCDIENMILPRTINFLSVRGLGTIHHDIKWINTFYTQSNTSTISLSAIFAKFVLPSNTIQQDLPFLNHTKQQSLSFKNSIKHELALEVTHTNQADRIVSNLGVQERLVSLSVSNDVVIMDLQVKGWTKILPNLRMLMVRDNQFCISNDQIVFPNLIFASVFGFTTSHTNQLLHSISFQCGGRLSSLCLGVIGTKPVWNDSSTVNINELFPCLEHLIIHSNMFQSTKTQFVIESLMERPTLPLSLCIICAEVDNTYFICEMLLRNQKVNTLHHLCVFTSTGVSFDRIVKCMPLSLKHLNIDLCYFENTFWSHQTWTAFGTPADFKRSAIHPDYHRLEQLQSLNITFALPFWMVEFSDQLSQVLLNTKVIFRIRHSYSAENYRFIQESVERIDQFEKGRETFQSIQKKFYFDGLDFDSNLFVFFLCRVFQIKMV